MSAAFRQSAVDWSAVAADLDELSVALTGDLFSKQRCEELQEIYRDAETFRSVVSMQRHNFGRGEYKYFTYPLPPVVQALREHFYAQLSPLANEWNARLGIDATWPASLQALTEQCRAGGQHRPTPLLLRYEKGDYNCLHQDRYGDILFPFQVIVLLSQPGIDFSGGELVLVEQRPRMQSRPTVVALRQGQAAIIPVRERPRPGSRGWYRTQLRHGVSRITGGERYTLGVIFHDAA